MSLQERNLKLRILLQKRHLREHQKTRLSLFQA